MADAFKSAVIAFVVAWVVILIFTAFGEWSWPDISAWEPFSRQMALYCASCASLAAFFWKWAK